VLVSLCFYNNLPHEDIAGEVWARGHHVMLGYWKDENKTREAISQSGWFKTG